MKKITLSLIILLLLCLSASSCSQLKSFYTYTLKDTIKYFSFNSNNQEEQKTNTIKVVSYNIKHAKNAQEAIQLLNSNQNLKNADILFLQEMTPDAIEKIAKALGYNYIFYPAIKHPKLKKDFGNAIVSKWPISDDYKILLPLSKRFARQRIAVGATTTIDNKKVAVVSVHLGIFVSPESRKKIANIIIDNIDASFDYCIIAGDFNSFTKKDRQELTEAFNEKDYNLATIDVNWTFKQWFFFNRKAKLDHIYTKRFGIKKAGKVINKSVSDHMPIWADLSLEKESSKENSANYFIELQNEEEENR